MNHIPFRYERELIEDFPDTAFGFILAKGLRNPPSNESLRHEFSEEQNATLKRLGQLSPAEIAPLAAWRRTYSAFGVSPTKYRCAAEALLRRLRKTGGLPGINTLVDIGNLISLRYSLPVLVYDVAQTKGMVTVGYSKGDAIYYELHQDTFVSPPEGEVIFWDENQQVIARRWCWRQSSQSAVSEKTSQAMLIVEAQHPEGLVDVQEAIKDAKRLFHRYTGEATEIAFGSARATDFAQ